jgi:hypothetical protein
MGLCSMVKKENLTITIDGDMLDSIRKLADKNFRSINKQIVFWLSIALQKNLEEKKEKNEND